MSNYLPDDTGNDHFFTGANIGTRRDYVGHAKRMESCNLSQLFMDIARKHPNPQKIVAAHVRHCMDEIAKDSTKRERLVGYRDYL